MSFTHGLAKIRENEENRAKPTPIAMVAPELKQYMDDTEISKTCAVLGCEDSKNLNSDSFFRFPEDLNLRQIWTDLTGRNNWTPTDYSYICVQHFSVDCFECDANNVVILNNKAVPSLKLPKHVLEVEYIDEETLDNEFEEDEDYLMESETETDGKYDTENTEYAGYDEASHSKRLTNSSIQIHNEQPTTSTAYKSSEKNGINKTQDIISSKGMELGKFHQQYTNLKSEAGKSKDFSSIEKTDVSRSKKNDSNKITQNKNQVEVDIEVLKLFTEVQKMQREAVNLKEKLKTNMRIYKRQGRFLTRMKQIIEMKKSLLSQKRKKKSRILLSLQDKMREDTNGLVLAMPTRHTDDLKNFALSIYKYSPQAYIYVRNTLRTLLPSTEVLESWVSSGYEPKNILSNSNLVKVVSELTESELTCKVSLR